MSYLKCCIDDIQPFYRRKQSVKLALKSYGNPNGTVLFNSRKRDPNRLSHFHQGTGTGLPYSVSSKVIASFGGDQKDISTWATHHWGKYFSLVILD
jgi:hypothetical protein